MHCKLYLKGIYANDMEMETWPHLLSLLAGGMSDLKLDRKLARPSLLGQHLLNIKIFVSLL